MRAAIVFLLAAFLSGCAKTVYVPVESVRHETEYRTVMQRDSVYVHDSVSVREKGDTLIVDRWHTRWQERVLIDTLRESQIDTIYKAYPVAQKLSKWNAFKVEYSVYVIFSLLFFCFLLVKFRK